MRHPVQIVEVEKGFMICQKDVRRIRPGKRFLLYEQARAPALKQSAQEEDQNQQDEGPMFMFRGGGSGGPVKLGFNNRFAFFILTSLIIMFLFMFVFNGGDTAMEEISYSTFLNYLENKSVESVRIMDNEEIQGYLTNVSGQHTAFKTRIPYFDDKLLERLEESGVKITGGVKNMTTYRLLVDVVPWLIGLTFIWLMFRNMSGGNKAIIKAVKPGTANITIRLYNGKTATCKVTVI